MATLNNILEVDLVFPRNNTYAPTDWFPVVFAFQNPEKAYYLNPEISYSIRNWDDMLGNDGASWTHDLRWTNWSSHDPYFVYTFFENFGVEGRWWLTWSITWQSCDEKTAPYYNQRDVKYNDSSWSILFTTKNSAPEVDLIAATANKTCPEELGTTINVTNQTMRLSSAMDSSAGDICIFVASSTPTPTPDPCQVKIDSTIVASISASLKSTLCKGVHPPSDCPEDDKSAAQKLIVIGVTYLLAAIGAFGFVLM